MAGEDDVDEDRARAHAHEERTVEVWAGRLVAGRIEARVLGEAFVRRVNCSVERHPRLASVRLAFSLSGEHDDVADVAAFLGREIGAIDRIGAMFRRQRRPFE